MAFIIDSYNRFDKWDFEHAVHIFEVNGGWYAIYRVQLEWGLPILPLRLEKQQYPENYFIYDTLEEAKRYVRTIKSLN